MKKGAIGVKTANWGLVSGCFANQGVVLAVKLQICLGGDGVQKLFFSKASRLKLMLLMRSLNHLPRMELPIMADKLR